MKRILFACVAAIVATPAFAQGVFPFGERAESAPTFSCGTSQGVEYTLDFQRREDGLPYRWLEKRISSQRCVTGATTYRLEGMPGTYHSRHDLERALKAFETLKDLKVGPNELVPAYAYLEGLRPPQQAAQKK